MSSRMPPWDWPGPGRPPWWSWRCRVPPTCTRARNWGSLSTPRFRPKPARTLPFSGRKAQKPDGTVAGFRCRGRRNNPGYGFSGSFPGEAAPPWLPQPESFGPLAADQQEIEEGSTLELYRAALAFRSVRNLGKGSLEWAEVHAPESGLLGFHNGDVLVLANMGFASAPIPEGYSVELSSGTALASEWGQMSEVPVDCAVYLTRN
jgi:hypothetical protein